MSDLSFSVIVPVHNGGEDLPLCLDAIAAASRPATECIVVDDASTDGVAAGYSDRPNIRVIQLETQQGPSIARNRGVAEATGDVVFFIDADVLVHPDTFETGINVLRADPDIAAVFGSYDDQPGHGAFISQYRNLYHHWIHQTARPKATTFWTGCGAVYRSIFADIGGFEPSIQRPSIEDIEFGSRLCVAGHQIRLEKTMQCTHLKEWSFWNMVVTDIFRRGIPWMTLLLSNREVPNDLNINYSSRAATLLAGSLFLLLPLLALTGHALAILPGLAFVAAAAGLSWFAVRPKINSLAMILAVVVAPLAAFYLAPDSLGLIPLLMVLLIASTQLAFYQYVLKKRNAAFALAVIPMQLVFFAGCALSAGVGITLHVFYSIREQFSR
jgi:GT2 family glycosyltransferase